MSHEKNIRGMLSEDSERSMERFVRDLFPVKIRALGELVAYHSNSGNL